MTFNPILLHLCQFVCYFYMYARLVSKIYLYTAQHPTKMQGTNQEQQNFVKTNI